MSLHLHNGICIFFTGLSGAGKSTIAVALDHALQTRGKKTTLLDGDVVRTHLSSELGFSREHRDLNIHRIGFVAAEVVKHGGIAISAAIAPYDSARRQARALVESNAVDEGRFLLVYLSTPLAACEARDVKGLYAKARRGEVAAFTGISDPYEIPTDADLVIDTSQVTVDEAVNAILAKINAVT
jgi:adenylyl-sulfate kinase